LALALTGCSTSTDKGPSTAGAGGTAGGGAGSGTDKAGSSAAGSSGSGSGTATEGKTCRTDVDCVSGLSCVTSVVANTGFHHCARSCSKDKPCMTGEMCLTATGSPDDLFCRNAVSEPFKACGPADTSFCADPLDCIFSDVQLGVPIGTCFNYCLLPEHTMTISDPTVLTTCPSGLTCVPLGDPDVGLCSMTAARGDLCGLEIAKLCALTDICVIDDVSGDSRCYQDCSKDGMCSDGKPCTKIQAPISICADPQ
jgi:hypothetical protein